MSHMNDEHGCSKAQAGEERYEEFEVRIGRVERRTRVQYDYRTPDGKLFSTVAASLEDARTQRDAWLAEQSK
jgi:hypothetical protein